MHVGILLRCVEDTFILVFITSPRCPYAPYVTFYINTCLFGLRHGGKKLGSGKIGILLAAADINVNKKEGV